MDSIEFFPYPLTVGLFILALVCYRNRRRGPAYLVISAIFGLYLLAVVDVMFFPFHLPDGWQANLVENAIRVLSFQTHSINLIPFYYGNLMSEAYDGRGGPMVWEILGNVILTIPFGFGVRFLVRPRGWHILWLALGAGITLEGLQFIFMLAEIGQPHSVDINDVLLNGVGVLLGYGLFSLGEWVIQWAFPHRIGKTL